MSAETLTPAADYQAGEHGADVHVPDVLETLAQLPNDDVYTPPKVVAAMLDILPAHVWAEPDYRWLDPATKSGIYLREVFKRLMIGLAEWEPDGTKRREHILKRMLYGAATTQLNGEIARRTLYQTKNATGKEVKDAALSDLVVQFDSPQGNIPFVETEHTIESGAKCRYCKAPATLVRADREQYAYSFIHDSYPTEAMRAMKFDVIVGNPPYQIGVEDNKRSRPLYQLFVERAIRMNPRYIVMITPSRWFAGGLGLEDYRAKMIADRHIKVMVDNPKIFDVFPQAKIRGGVSYFLWDREYEGDCEFTTKIDGRTISVTTRDLREGDGVLVRDNMGASIVKNVSARPWPLGSIETQVSTGVAFNDDFRTNFPGASDAPFPDSVPLVFGTKVGYVSRATIIKNLDWVDQWKVLIPNASSGDTPLDAQGRITDVVLGEPIALAPGSACTQSYLVAGTFKTRSETENFARFLTTKFVRFLVLQRKISQHVIAERFRNVPRLDYTRSWTDDELYELFNLAQEEIEYIEASIKPRSLILSLDSPIPETHLPGGRKYRAGNAPDENDETNEGE